MPDLDNDPIGAAFATFRLRETPMIKPAGLSPVRATIRRRRRTQIALTAVLTAVAVIIPAAGFAYTSYLHPSSPPIGTSPDPVGSPSPPPTTPSARPNPAPPSPSAPDSPPATGVPTQITTCHANQLTGAVTDQGSMSSQPFVVIALTNTSGSACQLTGYPQISARGHGQSTPSTTGTLPTTVTDGAIYERSDPGPHRLELAPNASASFALGTATAYDGGIFTITQLSIVLADQTSLQVSVSIGASAPTGQPIPVTVTAFVAGRSVPQ